ncbi:MAG TPA: hypothetical protein DHU63_02610 [Candidatus Marinimicrobia bacterium]|nr:MAG: hypothetical protein AUJ47_03645 [Candidatus Marinimicrobia bacterium CG1_02_48_14]PIZ70124.1 MAG: hypothetical protein COY19_00695 [Candidatus Marinimicrobia bacterium CG_4_10_14_0_2_um_filter_48_9]PJA52731.1 MAG: hypothetical protein CO167_08585 [Candidatus Marinimicrobia bacterium CG_4_9_14_3_um_filter_48_9]HCW75413.1 hypothetical protein [Candidatus Neomarinimicrobiota bacterium]
MTKKNWIVIGLFVGGLIILFGCAAGGGTYGPDDKAGFLSGIWHGWIAPITVIIGFFNDNIRIYEIHNTGWWYDFGFYMAVISEFGGLHLSRNRKDKI